jgi:hypothetical protein
MRFRHGCVLLLAMAFTSTAGAQDLYKTTLLQAAPGKLLELIEAQKRLDAAYGAAGEPVAYRMRHSQGDQWDLLLLIPIGSYSDYFAAPRLARRQRAERDSGWAARRSELLAWQEEVFVRGPAPERVAKVFSEARFFHVEMFIALPGKHAALVQQREMENAYLKEIGRPQNLIFVRDQGAAWDAYTIGFYRDLKHYAESADIPAEKEDAAARAAGFAAASKIGPYLRTLIRSHHDTLAVAVP